MTDKAKYLSERWIDLYRDALMSAPAVADIPDISYCYRIILDSGERTSIFVVVRDGKVIEVAQTGVDVDVIIEMHVDLARAAQSGDFIKVSKLLPFSGMTIDGPPHAQEAWYGFITADEQELAIVALHDVTDW